MTLSPFIKPDISSFENYTSSLCSLAGTLQDMEREHISEETAIMAVSCIKNMVISSEYDVVLCLTAFNVCNTYVKQRDHNPLFTYRFKLLLASMLSAVICNRIPSIKFDFQRDKGMNVMLVQAGNIQFSFHQVPLADSEIQQLSECNLVSVLPWDEIYKQNCAHTLFQTALSCRCNSNETFRGKDLGIKLDRQIKTYRSGRLNIAELYSFN